MFLLIHPTTAFLRGFLLSTLVLLVGSMVAEPVRAGCDHSQARFLEESNWSLRTHAESRSLIWIEYFDGQFLITHMPPAVPCDGPSCRAREKMEADPIISLGLRSQLRTTVLDRRVGTNASNRKDGAACHPHSETANRGGLSVLEHPPKIS
jgi:hypothetical protein